MKIKLSIIYMIYMYFFYMIHIYKYSRFSFVYKNALKTPCFFAFNVSIIFSSKIFALKDANNSPVSKYPKFYIYMFVSPTEIVKNDFS